MPPETSDAPVAVRLLPRVLLGLHGLALLWTLRIAALPSDGAIGAVIPGGLALLLLGAQLFVALPLQARARLTAGRPWTRHLFGWLVASLLPLVAVLVWSWRADLQLRRTDPAAVNLTLPPAP